MKLKPQNKNLLVSIIVAVSENNAIGKNNQLLWHLPGDLKFFKNTTWAMPVAMGRKTFQSLGGKPLKGRLNIVITRDESFKAEGVVAVTSVETAIALAEKEHYKELLIAGGGEIYKQSLTLAQKIYLTRVHRTIDGDTFFPTLGNEWMLETERHMQNDAKNIYDFSIQTWIRK
jgi:dihydrofolate reductase